MNLCDKVTDEGDEGQVSRKKFKKLV